MSAPHPALRSLQWVLRSLQFGAVSIVFSINTYFFVSLHQAKLSIPTRIPSVEGITGVALLYLIISSFLLRCLPGRSASSFVSMLFDLAFACAFIYVATAFKGGAGQCSGEVSTPYGHGDANDKIKGVSNAPTFHTACELQTACLAISILVIFFFLFSIFGSWALARNHQNAKRRSNDEIPESAQAEAEQYPEKKVGFLSRVATKFTGRKKQPVASHDPNALPEHAHPDQLALNGPTSYNGAPVSPVSPMSETAQYTPNHFETGYAYSLHDDNPYSGDTYQHAQMPDPSHHGAVASPYDPHFETPQLHQQPQPATTSTRHPYSPNMPHEYEYNDGIYDRPQNPFTYDRHY